MPMNGSRWATGDAIAEPRRGCLVTHRFGTSNVPASEGFPLVVSGETVRNRGFPARTHGNILIVRIDPLPVRGARANDRANRAVPGKGAAGWAGRRERTEENRYEARKKPAGRCHDDP